MPVPLPVVEFARALGWPPPTEWRHKKSATEELIWYESVVKNGATLFLSTQPRLVAAVRSVRHQIYTGYHDLRCGTTVHEVRIAASRLRPLLHSSIFLDLAARRSFRAAFPQYCGWTNARMIREGRVYLTQD